MQYCRATQTITSFVFDTRIPEESAKVKAHRKQAEAARKAKEAELRKRRDLLPPPMSKEEKLSLAEPKADMRKYTYCHKLHPKPIHRNWCGHSEMRWNGYGWEEE